MKHPYERNNYEMGVECACHGSIYESAGLTVEPVTESTMHDIDKILNDPYIDHHTVIALRQEKGIGSNGRKWETGTGNLMFSRMLRIEAHEFGQEMEMIAACAVAEIMQELLPFADVTTKYPNDVRINGEKICGCLVYPLHDSPEKVGTRRAINLGVGVNLAIAPEATQPTTCLAAHGCTIDIPAFMKKFDAQFTEILTQYRAEKNFDCVLRRMGFLDENNLLTLRNNEGGVMAQGRYQGFENKDGVPHLKLDGDRVHTLRSFHIVSGVQRQGVVAAENATRLSGAQPHA